MPSLTVWLIVAYALFALVIAWGFDVMAKYTAQRANHWHNGGFIYHPNHDAWLCPEDQWLWPQSFDPEQRIVLYQAQPSVCNNCPVKHNCTTSNSGKEMLRKIDPWPHSEAGRFHRGISCVIALISIILPLGGMVFFHSIADLLVLILTGSFCAMLSVPLARHLWNTPTNFPTPHLPGLIEKGI